MDEFERLALVTFPVWDPNPPVDVRRAEDALLAMLEFVLYFPRVGPI